MKINNTQQNSQALYVISVAAELAGVHPQTLRIYERRGLVQPARTTGGKQRRYSNADIAQLRRIAELAELGMNLEGIRQVMALEVLVEQLQSEIAQLRNHVARAANVRQGHYELVPLHQAMAIFGRHPGIFQEGR